MHEMTACYNVSVSCTGQGMVAQVNILLVTLIYMRMTLINQMFSEKCSLFHLFQYLMTVITMKL